MNADFKLNAEAAETQSEAYRAGHAQGKAHHGRGHHIPESNPHKAHTPEHADWHHGYEAGWESAFYAKHWRKKDSTTASTLS